MLGATDLPTVRAFVRARRFLVWCGVGCAALALLVGPRTAFAASTPTTRSCAWIAEPTYNAENILYPDTGTLYLGALAPVPPGGRVEITGSMPHARYFSLQTYTTTLQPIGSIHDSEIVPDAGSVNPYLPGANRAATNRQYTLTIVHGEPPASGGPANTLYDTSSSGQYGPTVVYRIYFPDQGTGQYGGEPAPTITLLTASGQRLPIPQCPNALPDTSAISNLLGSIAPPVSPPNDLFGEPTPLWHKYVNAVSSIATVYTDNPFLSGTVQQAVTALTNKLPAGFGENADNKYIYTELSTGYGRVALLHAKMPTTPRTYAGETTMGTGQLRYWSMCTGDQTTQTYGCTVDEQTPVDSSGDYNVVVSSPADRPVDATAACGVAWIPWGPLPQTLVLMRNMLPSPSFAQAIQNAQVGTERQVLGPYYPEGTYYPNAAAFAASYGCPASSTPQPATPGCPKATGRLAGPVLGRLRLGMTRRASRLAYTHSSARGRRSEEYFCLTPIGVRAGYASPRLLRTLPRSERRQLAGRVVWASTANPFYAVAGIRPGATLSAARHALRLGKKIVIGRNDWYLGPLSRATAVLKVRRGIVEEVGIADSRLTRTRRAQRTLMSSFL
jgi:hypothetical protein